MKELPVIPRGNIQLLEDIYYKELYMAFPTSPTNGQIYKDYQYNSSINSWMKSENKTFSSVRVVNTPAVQVDSLPSATTFSNENYRGTTRTILNVQSAFNATTGVFIAPEPGTYMITWNGIINTPGTGSHAYYRFFKNGSDISQYTHTTTGMTKVYEPLSSCITTTMNKNDTLEIKFTTLSSATVYSGIYAGLSIIKVK